MLVYTMCSENRPGAFIVTASNIDKISHFLVLPYLQQSHYEISTTAQTRRVVTLTQ